jgi:ribulose-phosphate 3-epimerase
VATLSRAPALSAGVLTADLTRLGAELEHLRGKAAWAHVDVMDGAFCPQLTVGPAFVAAVASTGIAVDAHLMIEEPRRMLADVAAAGAAVITVHAEATRHLHRTMTEMTALAGPARSFLRGVALNPGTPVCAVEPVLGLADLVLVLAVSPGWSGQEPAPGTRQRVEQVRELAGARWASASGTRCVRRARTGPTSRRSRRPACARGWSCSTGPAGRSGPARTWTAGPRPRPRT